MKIAFLSRYQNTEKRGVESFVFELTSRLSKNHDVEIFSGSDSDNFLKVASKNFDIIYPLNGRSQSLKFSFGRIFKKYKLVIGGHSGIGKDNIWNISVARPDIFIALTEAEKKWAKKWAFGVKVIKIPNGIDLNKFKPNGEKFKLDLKPPIILSVGALVWYKYHDRVINAVSKLTEGSLLIVGDGPLKKNLNDFGKAKLGNRFKIMQFDYNDIPKLYRSIDLFTLPSWDREAFGLVYLEALASNVPVVAPNDLSRKEIVGEGGILVDVSNPNIYVEALKNGLKANFLNKPRKQAEKFSWDNIALKYEGVFNELFKS